MEFGTEVAVRAHLRMDACDLFERIAAERRAKRRSGSAP
jgi:hypothetical protein